MPVDHLGEVVLPHFSEGLGEVVDNEAVVVGKEIVPHLRNLPTGEIEVQAIDKGHVISDHVGHRREQVACLDHDVHRLIGVAKQSDACVAGDRLLLRDLTRLVCLDIAAR